MTDLSRRRLLGFAPLLVCAPAIVRASSLMPVKRLILDDPLWVDGEYIVPKEMVSAIGGLERMRELLMPGIKKIALQYESIPTQWEKFWRVRVDDRLPPNDWYITTEHRHV